MVEVKDRNEGKPCWRVRRRIIIGILLFCGLTVGYMVLKGEDTELNRTIASSLILLAGSTVGSYVFGAVWDDKNRKS